MRFLSTPQQHKPHFMSLQNVLVIVEKAISDETYRDLLFKDAPVAASALSLQIEPPELAMLMNLSTSPYSSCRRGLIDVQKMVLAAMDYDAEQNTAAGQ
jgi:hypothetical protein